MLLLNRFGISSKTNYALFGGGTTSTPVVSSSKYVFANDTVAVGSSLLIARHTPASNSSSPSGF